MHFDLLFERNQVAPVRSAGFVFSNKRIRVDKWECLPWLCYLAEWQLGEVDLIRRTAVKALVWTFGMVQDDATARGPRAICRRRPGGCGGASWHQSGTRWQHALPARTEQARILRLETTAWWSWSDSNQPPKCYGTWLVSDQPTWSDTHPDCREFCCFA